ncbi:MAG: hypothetical protein KKD07_08930 [Candidatus Omnitrophica bacterium]|nr:hypothetical protein [Candidatus Omnitrophota bacterium]
MFPKKERPFEKVFLVLGTFLCFFIILVALKASLLPPHLPQEYDSLNYHITIPRQHLIANSFSHISWATADLFLLPIDYALAPYWLATKLPNKLPQLFFAIGLFFVLFSIVDRVAEEKNLGKFLIAFAVLGSHFIGIQLGIAMLDIVICYLMFASLDSLLRRRYVFAAVEFTFCFWSKPQVPVLVLTLFILLLMIIYILKKLRFKIYFIFESIKSLKRSVMKKFSVYFLILSVAIGGPFVAKSIKHTGSPLFPFLVGKVNLNPEINVKSDNMLEIVKVSDQLLGVKGQYGKGRGISAFIKHLWLIAVPEKGVNNSYDYPVGLPYLLCLGPFILLFFENIKKKKIDLMVIFIILYWGLWWLGSQQTRFLYVPIIAMYLVVLSKKRFLTKVFSAGMIISLILVSLSIFRAHKSEFWKEHTEVLRLRDKKLIEMSKTVDRDQMTKLDFEDAAFADFPIFVTNYKSSMFVLNAEKILR